MNPPPACVITQLWVTKGRDTFLFPIPTAPPCWLVPAVHYDRPRVRNASLCPVHLVQKAENPSRLVGHPVVRPAEILIVLHHPGTLVLRGAETHHPVRTPLPSLLLNKTGAKRPRTSALGKNPRGLSAPGLSHSVGTAAGDSPCPCARSPAPAGSSPGPRARSRCARRCSRTPWRSPCLASSGNICSAATWERCSLVGSWGGTPERLAGDAAALCEQPRGEGLRGTTRFLELCWEGAVLEVLLYGIPLHFCKSRAVPAWLERQLSSLTQPVTPSPARSPSLQAGTCSCPGRIRDSG